MEPRAFLELAQQLSRNTTSEASLRSCVSRSYYALFNFMAQFINENIERLPQTAKDHEKVYYYFNNCGVEDVESIASDLNDLRDERNDSDYRLHVTKFKNEKTVSFLFNKASISFNSFENVMQSSEKRRRIVEGIRKYKEMTNS